MGNFDRLKEMLQASTRAANNRFADRLPLDDTKEFDAARRGQIAKPPARGVAGPPGAHKQAWNIAEWDFLDTDCRKFTAISAIDKNRARCAIFF